MFGEAGQGADCARGAGLAGAAPSGYGVAWPDAAWPLHRRSAAAAAGQVDTGTAVAGGVDGATDAGQVHGASCPDAADAVPPHAVAGRRAVAALVDLVLVGGLTIGLAVGLDRLAGRSDSRPASGSTLLDALALLVVVALPLAWFVVGEAWRGATPGKWLLGLHVTRHSASGIGFRRAGSRLLYRSAFFGVLGVLGLFRREGPWHDRWTGTEVRRRGRRRRPADPDAQPAVDPAPEPTARSAPEPAVPHAPQRVSCRCRELHELRGDEAATYARTHLLSVRRWPEAGRFELVCPTTRYSWVARDAWATEQGETSLVRRDSEDIASPGA